MNSALQNRLTATFHTGAIFTGKQCPPSQKARADSLRGALFAETIFTI